ncbi:HD domain-containing protein [Vibrio sp. JC009]|uniref:HD domain-containing phosphohydrolase n=1 Tax=Vibrio sp. JC009 TaxID=2912314 RepID=UPI0023B00D44|nr:HD domain-containing phosphohydrolase [Vibrio sp. JC009]WED21269.1 HD domain-containing protein [Vibrio sp. JC009]
MRTMNNTGIPMHAHPNQLNSLNHELTDLHKKVKTKVPALDRIAFVLYDKDLGLLKTYAESSDNIDSFNHHEFPLSSCTSLKECADSSQPRVINDIPSTLIPNNKHSRWLLDQGYRSSFTVPIYNFQQFIGFVFFNSHKKGLFTQLVQNELLPYCDLISFVVNAEYSLLHSILASAELTKELSPGYKKESREHVERMSRYSHLIAKGVAEIYQLDDEVIENIHIFSRLHDIGKSALPKDLLLKPDNLQYDERDIMKAHINNGISLIDKILDNLGKPSHPCVDILKDIIACHQEFLDGSGYPNGLSHTEISVPTRIITVANIFDALTSHRPYKQACSVPAALLELEKMVSAGKLDENCVSALRDHHDLLNEIIKQFPERDPSISYN